MEQSPTGKPGKSLKRDKDYEAIPFPFAEFRTWIIVIASKSIFLVLIR